MKAADQGDFGYGSMDNMKVSRELIPTTPSNFPVLPLRPDWKTCMTWPTRKVSEINLKVRAASRL